MKRIFFTFIAALMAFVGVSAQVNLQEVEFTADQPATVELQRDINSFTFTAP